MVQFDGAFGDGESEPHPAAGAAPVLFHPLERIEDKHEGFGGNAGAEVPHGDPI
jgi:hypothetical protein